ncbi:MAG: ATP-binding protein [Bacteroidales bacterium]|nr:ATP-binding protein [Candidatus Liminaster caballi]
MERIKTNKTAVSKMSVIELAETIVNMTDNSESVSVDCDAKSYIKELAKRLDLTPMQALLLSVFLNQYDDTRICYKDIARHFDVRPISIIAIADVIDSIVARGVLIKRIDKDGDVTFRMPNKTLNSLRRDTLPEPEAKTGLDAHTFMDRITNYLELRDNEEIEDDELHLSINELLAGNADLPICKNISELKLSDSDLVLLFVMTMLFRDNHDDNIGRSDIDDYFYKSELACHIEGLSSGNHKLMEHHLVEHRCEDGQVNTERWKLTEYAKGEVLVGLNFAVKKDNRSNLTRHEDIAEKDMFYNERVTKQVDKLKELLEGNKMKRVMQRLKDKGMRQGFPCLFYGAPGTGKTETVLQLARMTGRDIMLVDVPSIRSKWVGETEQNIKAVFDRYARLARNNEKAPILLFNEADALLNKRAEGATGSVDKMENAMQNIILQEMENLEGIMIATTNLTGSLDAAFERRFLFKIEFDKPTPKESLHIWKAMLPDLTDEQALNLAETYQFSGGQIENIARKHTIDTILDDADELSIAAIKEACRQETLNKQGKRLIGFA